MKKILTGFAPLFLILSQVFFSCHEKSNVPATAAINAINLKKGEVVLCGPPDKQLGTVAFETSCSQKVKKDVNLALALLHSFEYDEAEKVFAKIIDEEPGCAMAYWGVAMCNYHQLWPAQPTRAELEKGSKAISIAQLLTKKSASEAGYINAMAAFYKDWDKTDHHTRSLLFEQAMQKLYETYPADKEVAIFYSLALDGAADPADKTFRNQKKAGAILQALYPNEPNHPGIVHYIIHSYDSPELAALGLDAARKYASIAPSSAHAQHMPSHIFTRLGLWDECIQSNLVSMSSAQCYAEGAGIKGHWDEELHAMDYLAYAYLQKADNKLARAQYDYLKTIKEVYPANFKVAYAFAAIPARYMLENKNWKDAATLELLPANIPWNKFPWQKAIFHFTKAMGAAHTGNLAAARAELTTLQILHDTLVAQKDPYKANQVQIQANTAAAWIALAAGKQNDALQLMSAAAELEDKTEKSPVTPGEVIPASELLGDMLMEMNQPAKAADAYAADLKKHPNRFNGLYGAALAAEKSNNPDSALMYYKQLLAVANSVNANRPELDKAKLFTQRKK